MNAPDVTLNSKYSRFNTFFIESKFEFIRMLRMPMFAMPALIFPAMFYLLFGVLLNKSSGNASTYLLATYCIFGVMGPGLFGFGVSVALEKDLGWLKWRRAVPALASAYFISKMVMALIFSFIIYIELALLAYFFGGVELSTVQWLQLLLVSLVSSLPFSAMGLVIGTLVNGQAAPAIVNFLYLPMAFLSGLWLPISMLPKFLGTLAPIWPSYHASQIALKIVGQDLGAPLWQHLAYLALFTGAMLWLSMIFWSRMKLK